VNGWDYLAGANCVLGGVFLVIHAVMVGNPQYGWQPRSIVVRGQMIVAAVFMVARGYTIFFLDQPVGEVGQWAAWALAFLFFVSWLDMMVASWRKAANEASEAALTRSAKVIRHVGAAASAARREAATAATQSAENGRTLDRIAEAVSILEPAPTEFKDSIGYRPERVS
jgi:hypothetical protein